MDALVWIAAMMSAIVFTWVGYFLGNVLPVSRLKGEDEDQYQKGLRGAGGDSGPVNLIVSRIRGWLLDRDKDRDQSEEPVESVEGLEMDGGEEGGGERQEEEAQPAAAVQAPRSPIPGGEGTIHVWQERNSEKFFAEVDGLLLDLNKPLAPEDHNKLTFLLVDLQDKVGVSATIQAKIAERLDEALPDEEEKAMARPSFNPMKSMLDYVKADVPKLVEAEESIPAKINAILQKMLLNTPLDKRGISMGEWPGRGVVFMVGLDIYDEIDQIPDEDIRLVIRNAVAAWEAEQKGE